MKRFCIDKTEFAYKKFTSDDFEYSIIPVPKYDEETQATTLLASYVTAYAIPLYNKTRGTANESAAFIEAMASEGYRTVSPVVFELSFKVKYSSDPETTQCFDILRDTVSFDYARIYRDELVSVNLLRNTCKQNDAANWPAKAESTMITMDFKLGILQDLILGLE